MSNEAAIEEAIHVLNRIHRSDPMVLPKLISHRVVCNQYLSEDPTVQVGTREEDGQFEVGLLGIINGLFGINPHGVGFIVAVYDNNNNNLMYFRRSRESDFQ